MFAVCRRAAFIQQHCKVQIYFTSRTYSTSGVRLGVLQKVTDRCERYLEQRFPRFSILYQTMTRGFQLLFGDVKEVWRIKMMMRRNKVHYRELSYRDMERLVLFRRDMIKAIPLLVISLPPFAIGFVLLLMCLFPRQLLFRHFWTPQQQRKFQSAVHARRSRCQVEVLNNMVRAVPSVSGWRQRVTLFNLCSKVQSGTHPSVSELHATRPVFSSPPLLIESLRPSHLRPLASQLSVTVWLPSFLLRRRVTTRALDLLYLDRALKVLGLDRLSQDEMRQACDLRGLDTSRLSSSQCKEWLHQWLQLSAQVKESELSLLLHAMALLTLNYPPELK